MKKHAKSGGHIFRQCLPLCVISPSSVMIQRSLFDEIGLFDESLPACEDYDLWLRICARHPVLFLQEPMIIKHGGHRDQLSRRYWGMDRFRIQALEKIIDAPGLSPADRIAVAEMLDPQDRHPGPGGPQKAQPGTGPALSGKAAEVSGAAGPLGAVP